MFAIFCSHLPLGLVAAFAKRFSRLLLQATPPDMLILLTFIANLLIRHPDLSFLCHKPNSKQGKYIGLNIFSLN